MNQRLIDLYAHLQVRLAAARDDEGQGTLEYVGIVIVAALLVTAVVDAIGNGSAIQNAISSKIQEIVSKG